MEKGILEFDLKDPDSAQNFKIAAHYMEIYLAIHEYFKEMRDTIKFQSHKYPAEYISGLGDARDKLQECLTERGIDSGLFY